MAKSELRMRSRGACILLDVVTYRIFGDGIASDSQDVRVNGNMQAAQGCFFSRTAGVTDNDETCLKGLTAKPWPLYAEGDRDLDRHHTSWRLPASAKSRVFLVHARSVVSQRSLLDLTLSVRIQVLRVYLCLS